MKQIIKNDLKLKKAKCPDCDCEFAFNITDITTNKFAYALTCPVCENVIKECNNISRRNFFDIFEDYKE